MNVQKGISNHGRRRFLQGSAALTAGLLLELSPGGRVALASAGTDAATVFTPNAWVEVTPDNVVRLVVHKFDSGTGVKNALGLIVAEELDADWSTVEIITPDNPLADAYKHPLWGMHATGGSTSVALEWANLRKAGATARAMLVNAAAKQWDVDAASCHTESGKVIHEASGRSASYGELAAAAAALPVPEDVPLKDVNDFSLIGKQHNSYRVKDKVTGQAQYAIDIKLPGMLTAVVVHSPVLNAPVKSFNEDEMKALPGIHDVFVIDIPEDVTHFRSGKGRVRPQNGAIQPGIAIVADNYWSAQKARKKLKVEWGDSEFSDLDSDDVIQSFLERVDDEGRKSKTAGNAKDTFEHSAHVVEATYSMPYKAHVQLEPISMIAWVKPDEVEYWGGAQVPTRCAQAAETITGISRDKVKIHITEAGGSFGNREGFHWMLEVTYISKRVNRPVKLLYSREDDIQQLYYHSASVHKARAALTPKGDMAAFSLRAVVPSIKEPDDPGFLENMPVDPSCTEAMRDDFYYDIDGLDLAWVRQEPGVPIWWWRAVSYVPNVFAIESLVDEAAISAGQDPYQYRRALLKNRPEHLAVLDRAAEMAAWPTDGQADNRALGIATYEGYKSYIAVVADVTVKDNAVTINHITCAVDCGLVIDPSSAHHQIYGGIVWGISTALHDEITLRQGKVEQSNFHDYPVPRMADVPPIDVEFMPPSDRQPGGVGELSNPIVAPAIGNAIYAAIGQRLRSTPFRMT